MLTRVSSWPQPPQFKSCIESWIIETVSTLNKYVSKNCVYIYTCVCVYIDLKQLRVEVILHLSLHRLILPPLSPLAAAAAAAWYFDWVSDHWQGCFSRAASRLKGEKRRSGYSDTGRSICRRAFRLPHENEIWNRYSRWDAATFQSGRPKTKKNGGETPLHSRALVSALVLCTWRCCLTMNTVEEEAALLHANSLRVRRVYAVYLFKISC